MRAKRLTNCGKGSFELADQHTAGSWDGKAGAVRASGQGERQIGDQQGFPHLGFAADEQDTLCRQQPWLDQARGCGWLLFQ
jgi:hypothetical protein